ncbi:hypothetical protein BTVI_83861 [Pitangus sulphuratus]|nr:hypothetical protein BTVI_83861 [Pitangus sulphuratus]
MAHANTLAMLMWKDDVPPIVDKVACQLCEYKDSISSLLVLTVEDLSDKLTRDSSTSVIFTNDIDEEIECILNKFTADTKLSGVVGTPEGWDAIQKDLEKLQKWAHGV